MLRVFGLNGLTEDFCIVDPEFAIDFEVVFTLKRFERIAGRAVIPPILTTLKSRGFNKHFQSSVLEAHHQSLNEVARYYKSKAIELRSFERAQLIQTNANPATLALRFD